MDFVVIKSQVQSARPPTIEIWLRFAICTEKVTLHLKSNSPEAGDAGPRVVRLLWASRTESDTFWRDQIAVLQRMYPERFEIVEIISQDPAYAAKAGALVGRITPEVLHAVFDSHWGTFVGGPQKGSCVSGSKPMAAKAQFPTADLRESLRGNGSHYGWTGVTTVEPQSLWLS